MPSPYLSRFRIAAWHGIKRSVIGKKDGLQESIELLTCQGKLFGNSRFFHSNASTLTDLYVVVRPGISVAARSDFQLVDQRRNLSVVGALSRTFFIQSISGPSLQGCGYHVHRLLSDPSVSSIGSKFQNIPMAPRGSRAHYFSRNLGSKRGRVFGSLNGGGGGVRNQNGTSVCCKKSVTSLRKQEQSNNYLVCGYFISTNFARRICNSSSYLESWLKGFHSSSESLSAGSVPDVSFDSSSPEDLLTNSTVSSEQKLPVDRNVILLSGSCYLPHPDKEETGGEDAHFICMDKQAIGVADGVGGWAAHGVDAGKYARELMSNSVIAIQEEPKGSVDPLRVLEKAYTSTKAKGSSTACIIALTDQGLHAINLGDSGFMVIRDGCTIFRSPVQQHDFNFTYQLESENGSDLPSSGQVFTIPVAHGDVIIAGTDGLFDNLYNTEVTGVVVHAVRAGFGPQVAAQKIAALARERAQDKNRQTPFSTAAQDAGFRYYGGKLDDITVVVSYIKTSINENHTSTSVCASV